MTGFTLLKIKALADAQEKFREQVLEELRELREQQEEMLEILRGFQRRAKK